MMVVCVAASFRPPEKWLSHPHRLLVDSPGLDGASVEFRLAERANA
jgi:hypothetical protein